MKRETVCAIVVTFNRKDLLLKCLESLRNQTKSLDAIYIIDNASIDGTPQLLKEKGYILKLPSSNLKEPEEQENEILSSKNTKIKVYYVRMHENTGGSGGFYEGMKRAHQRGFDWYWLMDDDVEMMKHALETLLKYKDKGDLILPHKMYFDGTKFKWLPLKINLDSGYVINFLKNALFNTNIIQEKKDLVYCDVSCFEGVLIKKKVIDKICYPRKEYFIFGDDTEYGIRASLNGFKNLYIPEYLIIRNRNENSKHHFLKRRYSILSIYFGLRNLTNLAYNLSKNKIYFFAITFMYYLMLNVSAILRRDFRAIVLYFFALVDGLSGRFGREKMILRMMSSRKK